MRILKLLSVTGVAAFSAAAPAHAAGLPQLDVSTFSAQVVWLVITFVILYVLMSRMALPRIGEVLEERQNKIDDNLARADELKSQADAASDAYQASIANARTKAHDAIRGVKDKAAAEADKSQKALNEKLQARIAKAEATIAKSRDDALAGIRDVAVEVAAVAVEKLTGEAPADKSVSGAVDAALKGRA